VSDAIFKEVNFMACKYKKVLFLCTSNINRSKTAEHLAADFFDDTEFKSAGLSKKECLRSNTTLCTEELIHWADIVFTFEPMHEQRIREHLGDAALNIISLEIEDIYTYYQPELVGILTEKLMYKRGNCTN
jgi:predicted protein tyrosine phosphatase